MFISFDCCTTTTIISSRISSTHPTYSSFAITGLWSFGCKTHACSNVAITPLSRVVKCSLALAT
jgi:hypothetical protein